MIELTHNTVRHTARTVSGALSRWPSWAAYVAGAWSLMYGAFGLYWTLGGAGFPFGTENDPAAALSVLANAQAATSAPVIAVLGLVGAVVALAMARLLGRGFQRAVLLSFAWTATATLAIILPDYRVLVTVAYAPLFVIGAPFGWPPGANFLDALTWPIVNQFVLVSGGFVWAMAAVAYQRRARDACGNCGRTDAGTVWTTPSAAAQWGRWATYVAVVIPLFYATTRWAWALGIPLGISEEFLREGQASGLWVAGAGLATLAIGGAILTLGLVQWWGEAFPRWIPFFASKRVPIWLAVVPASLVSVFVTTAGLMFVRLTVTGTLGETFGFVGEGDWAVLGPELLWPIWGVALGVATLAYYYRRRGRCRHCGRGSSPNSGPMKITEGGHSYAR
jgi:hypothetical protein